MPPRQTCENSLADAYVSFLTALKCQAPDKWTFPLDSVSPIHWCVFREPNRTLPSQGWKIHLTASPEEALGFARRVLPYLILYSCAFKIAASVEAIIAINSGVAGETQIGKILTVYPFDDAEIPVLCERLDALWPHSRGPTVLSDLQFRRGGAVFLRYGAFRPERYFVDTKGIHHVALIAVDGSVYADERTLTGCQTDSARKAPVLTYCPPIPDYSVTITGSKGTYLPVLLLHSSPKSKVFLGLELSHVHTVVMKYVRRGAWADINGSDACEKLLNEFLMLQCLQRTEAPVPTPVELLQSGTEAILILRDVSGSSLYGLSRDKQISWLSELVSSVSRLHAAGVVHRDLKLANTIVNGSSIVLCDLELAAPIGAAQPFIGGTIAHNSGDAAAVSADPSSDIYSLGVCIAHAYLGHDPSRLLLNPRRLIGLLKVLSLGAIGRCVSTCLCKDRGRRPTAHMLHYLIKGAAGRSSEEIAIRRLSRKWIMRAVLEAGFATRRYQETTALGTAYRNEHFQREFRCGGINLGSAGILLGLMTIDHALGSSHFRDDIESGARWLSTQTPLPCIGLFTGGAGIALCLCVASRYLARSSLLEQARNHLTTMSPERDLFVGSAGSLYAACLIHRLARPPWAECIAHRHAEYLIRERKFIEEVIVWEQETDTGAAEHYFGAAHGAAGIALALAKYSQLFGSVEALEIAEEVFACIRRHAVNQGIEFVPTSLEKRDYISSGNWCHGTAGYLWSILLAFGENPRMQKEIDWAADSFAKSSCIGNPTYCHGVSGQLELWRMLARIPRFRSTALRRMHQSAHVLRSLHCRRARLSMWFSETPDVITPDLWIGFLAPATSLALYAIGSKDALLSDAWLKRLTYAG
jgi:Lanthionine synthetase C-like protein/Protein kinase domain